MATILHLTTQVLIITPAQVTDLTMIRTPGVKTIETLGEEEIMRTKIMRIEIMTDPEMMGVVKIVMGGHQTDRVAPVPQEARVIQTPVMTTTSMTSIETGPPEMALGEARTGTLEDQVRQEYLNPFPCSTFPNYP